MAWEIRNDYIYATPPWADEDAEMVQLCERVETMEKHVDLLTGAEKLLIAITLPYTTKKVWIDRGDVKPNRILPPLINLGLTVLETMDSIAVIIDVILTTEKEVPITYTHDQLGFAKVGDTHCFLGHHPVGNLPALQSRSTYHRAAVTKPRGSPELWRRMMLDVGVDCPPICLAIALGVTAPVAHLLREDGLFLEVPLFALIGESSSGKTTMLQLAASLWGSPMHLLRNFHATTNAFFAMMRDQSGLPVLVDEGTIAKDFDFDSLLYALPEGRGKLRCTSNGDPRDPIEFSGSIILTSERSVLERAQGYKGQQARILEFSLPWTRSAEEADRIKSVCVSNYGWAGNAIASILIDKGSKRKLKRKFRFFVKRLLSEIDRPPSGVEDRLVKRMALILTSGWVAEKALRLGLHLEKLIRLLTGVFEESTTSIAEQDDAEVLVNNVMSHIASHGSKYPEASDATRGKKPYATVDAWGVKDYYGNKRCVWILADQFEPLIRKNVTCSHRTACRKLESKGVLQRFYGDRFVKEHLVNGAIAKCYCLLLPNQPGVVQTISAMKPGDRSISKIERALTFDPYGVFNDFANDKLLSLNQKRPLFAIGFLRLGAQHCRMILNNALVEALKTTVGSPLYLLPVPHLKIMILSTEALASNASKIRLSFSDGRHFADLENFYDLLRAFGRKLGLYQRLVMTDLSIEKVGPTSVAIINLENDYNTWTGELNPSDLCSIDDNINRDGTQDAPSAPKKTNRSYLLSEDD